MLVNPVNNGTTHASAEIILIFLLLLWYFFFTVFSLDAFFNFIFNIRFGIIEFTDSTADSSHQVGNFLTTEKQEYNQNNQYPLAATRASIIVV